MSKILKNKEGLQTGITGPYSGEISALVLQKNGRIRINNKCLIKRKRKNA